MTLDDLARAEAALQPGRIRERKASNAKRETSSGTCWVEGAPPKAQYPWGDAKWREAGDVPLPGYAAERLAEIGLADAAGVLDGWSRNAVSFISANVLSPVIEGSTLPGGGAVYVLADGRSFMLTAEDCTRVGMPIWKFMLD